MINTIKALFTIDDKGSLKKTTDKAERASSSLNNLGRTAGEADRRLKGTGQQSSNTTKNFSKMAQGVDGFLVPAYATLAAQLFAVSAAFQFLKQAGDLKTLKAGQLAYTSATGVAMKSLTNDIIEATGAQVNFTDASQAAAIGIAAGLSTDQLTRLGKAAKDASAVLGRDVTDSFNRLVRGVTKAEPELLDELGVILRLKDASKEYADALGINESALTTYQKSQAVVNNVLAQTESKYSRILEITGGGQANQFAQLGKAFNDVLMKIQEVVATIAGPLARVLTETPSLAFAAFGLLISGPLSAMGLNFREMAQEAQKSATVQARAAKIAQIRLDKKTVSIEAATAAFKKQAVVAKQAAMATKAGTASPTLQMAADKGLGGMTSQARANLNKAVDSALKNVNKKGIVTKGIFKDMSVQIAKDYRIALDQMTAAEQKKVTQSQINAAKIGAGWSRATAAVKGFGAGLMNVGTRMVSFLGYIGIAYTLFELLRDLTGWFKTAPDPLQKTKDKLSELKDEYKDFLEVQKELLSGDGIKIAATGGYSNIAKMINSVSDPKAVKESLKLLTDGTRKFQEELSKIEASNLEDYATSGIMRLSPSEIRGEAMSRLEDGERDAVLFFERQIQAIEQVKKETGIASKVFDEYLNALKSGDRERILQAKDAVAAVGTMIDQMEKLRDSSTQASDTFFKQFSPSNAATQAISALRAEILNLQNEDLNNILNAEQKKRLEEAQTDLKKILTISRAIAELEREKTYLQIAENKALRGATPLQKETLSNLFKQRNTEIELQSARQDELNILNHIKDNNGKATEEQIQQLNNLQAKKALLNDNLVALRQELDLMSQLGDVFRNSFEGNMTKGLTDLITGKESSLRDAIGNLAKGVLEDIAGQLAKNISKMTSDLLFGSEEDKMYNKIMQAHTQGGDMVATKIISAFNTANTGQLRADMVTKVGTDGVRRKIIKTDTNVQADVVTQAHTAIVQEQDALVDRFEKENKGLVDNLGGIFGSFLSGIGGLFGKFFGMFGSEGGLSFLQEAGKGILGALGFGNAEGARYGGVLQAYSAGGIAKGSQAGFPAILHGTEAVVPLPHGNAIPVEMRGNSGGVNNISVSVNIDNSGKSDTQTQGDTDGAALGKAVALAVQEELKNQKRSGGILNPYGVA